MVKADQLKDNSVTLCEKRYKSTYTCKKGESAFADPTKNEGKFSFVDKRFRKVNKRTNVL